MEQLIKEPLTPNQTIQTAETAKQYVQRVFPLEKGEYRVTYYPVGGNNFRINFYTKRNPGKVFSDSYIGRSYYVILKKDGNSWSHKAIV